MKNEKTNINQHMNECLVSNAILWKNFNQMQPSSLLLLGFDPRVIVIHQFTKSSTSKSVFFKAIKVVFFPFFGGNFKKKIPEMIFWGVFNCQFSEEKWSKKNFLDEEWSYAYLEV